MKLLPRSALPQIPKEEQDNFREFLEGNDVKTSLKRIKANALKPIQAEVNQEKVDKFKKDPQLLAEPLIVSKDNFVLDGHHRWKAAMEIDSDQKMLCIVCDCSIRQLVELGHEFDGSFTKTMKEWMIYG